MPADHEQFCCCRLVEQLVDGLAVHEHHLDRRSRATRARRFQRTSTSTRVVSPWRTPTSRSVAPESATADRAQRTAASPHGEPSTPTTTTLLGLEALRLWVTDPDCLSGPEARTTSPRSSTSTTRHVASRRSRVRTGLATWANSPSGDPTTITSVSELRVLRASVASPAKSTTGNGHLSLVHDGGPPSTLTIWIEAGAREEDCCA
jgi:hypothetical protein